MKTLVACPYSLRVDRKGQVYETLPFWISSIRRLQGEFDTFVFLNDLPPDVFNRSTALLDEAGIPWEYEDFGYPIDARNRATRRPANKPNYERFCEVRNHVLDYAIAGGYDCLLSIDSDLIVRPETLLRLLDDFSATQGVLIAVLVNNTIRARQTGSQARYNFGIQHNRDQILPVRGREIKDEKLQKVAYTGACGLINLRFIKDHRIRYGPHDQGEDLTFCNGIHDAGGHVWVDCAPEFEAFHIQEPWLIPYLDDYLAGNPPYASLK